MRVSQSLYPGAEVHCVTDHAKRTRIGSHPEAGQASSEDPI